jgi:hypothetical protein
MDKTYPDKWVRKAIYDAVDGISVGGETVNVYDRRTGMNNPKSGVILQEQRNEVVKDTKCDYRWRHTILIEVFDRIPDVGNSGSRVNADDIMEAVKDGIINLTLDVGSGLTIINENLTFPGDLSNADGTEILNRKFLRVLYLIN